MKAKILFAILLLAGTQLKAQKNVALTATATQSVGLGSLPGFGATNYNDNIIPTCTTSCSDCSAAPYGVVTGGTRQWIEYRWSSELPFNKVIFYKGDRPLIKTKLQYWNGSAYVDIANYNSAACPVDSISFPSVTTTRLRFYGMDAGKAGPGPFDPSISPNFREIKVIDSLPPCNTFPGTIAGSHPSGTGNCANTFINLTVTGAAISKRGEIQHQWQRRRLTFPVPEWTNINGITGLTLEGDTLLDWEYRFIVFCKATNDTGFTAAYSLPQLPTPVIRITTPGPISVCEGDTAWLLASNHTGGVYTWMKDGVAVPGWKFSDFGASEAGMYTVKVETTDPCPGYSQPVKVGRIDPGFSAGISTVADSILCQGETVTLLGSSSKAGVTYQWMKNNAPLPGATGPSFTVRTGGYYKVLASDGSDCPAASRNTFITVHPKPAADIAVPDGTLSACEGKGVLLVSSDAYEYQWSFNGSPVVGWNEGSLLVKNSGRYAVKIRSSEGCVNTSANVSVSILPAPEPVISRSGLVLSTDRSFSFYRWIRNGKENVASGTGKNTFNLVKSGLYTVIVTDENGCDGTSDPIEALDATLSVGNIVEGDQQILVYPNPAGEKVFIKSPVPVGVRVESITGRLLYSGKNVSEIDLHGYANGMYLFTITDQEGNKIAIQKIYKMID